MFTFNIQNKQNIFRNYITINIADFVVSLENVSEVFELYILKDKLLVSISKYFYHLVRSESDRNVFKSKNIHIIYFFILQCMCKCNQRC